MRHIATMVVSLLAAAGLLFSAFPAATAADVAAAPTGVTIPKGYRNWQVVAPSQRDDKDEIRVILGNDIAMKGYRAKQLPFPDGTILAKLAWKRVKSAEFDNTFVPGEPQRVEFMVKNAKKYAGTGGGGSAGSSTASPRTRSSTSPAGPATRPT